MAVTSAQENGPVCGFWPLILTCPASLWMAMASDASLATWSTPFGVTVALTEKRHRSSSASMVNWRRTRTAPSRQDIAPSGVAITDPPTVEPRYTHDFLPSSDPILLPSWWIFLKISIRQNGSIYGLYTARIEPERPP